MEKNFYRKGGKKRHVGGKGIELYRNFYDLLLDWQLRKIDGFDWYFIIFWQNTYLLLKDHVLEVEMGMLVFKIHFIIDIRRLNKIY